MAINRECPGCHDRNPVGRRKCRRCGRSLEGGVYWVDVKVKGKRVRRRVGPSRTEALRLEAEIRRILLGKETLNEEEEKTETDGLTLEKLWNERYWPWCLLHNRSPETKLFRWRKHLKPEFGKLQLEDVRPPMVEDYKRRRILLGAKPSTVNKEIRLLRHMLRMAVRWGILGEDPLREVEMAPERDPDVWTYLRRDEAERLIQTINPTYRDLLEFLLFTGLRVGDALRLRWEDVDLDRGVLYVRGSRTKSGRPFGVPLHERARAVLERRNEEVLRDATGIDWRSLRIFPHSEDWFRRAFKKALRETGLPESIRIHDLRHTFASWLALSGAPLQDIQALLGHRQITTTLRYAHLNPDVLRRSLSRI